MEEISFWVEEVAQLISAAELILKLIGKAQGRADSYAARRDEFKIIEFPNAKKKPMQVRRLRKQEQIVKFRHF